MRIVTNNNITGVSQGLCYKLVANSLTDIAELKPLFPGKSSEEDMVVGKFPNRAGYCMVDEDVGFFGIKNGLEIGLLVLPES